MENIITRTRKKIKKFVQKCFLSILYQAEESHSVKGNVTVETRETEVDCRYICLLTRLAVHGKIEKQSPTTETEKKVGSNREKGKYMLKIEHLTKIYGEKKAVDDLSLHIAPGEIYGFIGHNGAGKTTTIKACTGILQFDAGEIFIDGISMRNNPLACKKKLAYIPDNPDLYEFMTGIRFLHFVADVFGVSAEERRERIAKYADMLELTDALAQPISAYSHGMKQKLAIVSALIHEPKLIIMDEPFVGLDPKASHKLKMLMREVCDGGGAIFFSTHVLEVAEKLCDKIAIIKDGKLIRSGKTEDVKGDVSLEEVFLELEDEE